MKNFINQFLTRLPSKSGQKSLDQLLHQLSHGGINFKITSHQDDSQRYLMAEAGVAGRFIVTSGKNLLELDQNVKDALFTAYRVPRFYCDNGLITSPANL